MDPPFNTGRAQARRTLSVVADADGDRVGLRRPALPLAAAADAELRRRLRRLPGVSGAAAGARAGAAGAARDALLPHRLPRGALLQAAARRGVRPRRVPERADLEPTTTAPSRAGAGRPSTTRSSSTCARPAAHWFDADAVEREPYMAPGLVSAEKAARGKRPTDVWFHTIVPDQRPREDGLPDAEARGGAAAARRRLLAAGRLVPGSVRGLGDARRGLPGAGPAVRARRSSNPVAIEVMRLGAGWRWLVRGREPAAQTAPARADGALIAARARAASSDQMLLLRADRRDQAAAVGELVLERVGDRRRPSRRPR